MSFFTPPMPSPLNLDLAELWGGGSCPSQFEGETHEGQDVYVRYRGGDLTVDIAKVAGMSVFDDANRVLDINIGPPYDGSMSLTQFCKMFAVTINGQIPEEVDPDAPTYKDLSGQTTFWNYRLNPVTVPTSREILRGFCSIMPDGLLLQPRHDERSEYAGLALAKPETVKSSVVFLVDGVREIEEVPTSPENFIAPKPGQLQISMSCFLWSDGRPMYGIVGQDYISSEVGRSVFQAGYKNVPDEIAITSGSLSMSASFPTNDNLSRSKLEALETLAGGFLKETQLEKIDLVSKEQVAERTSLVDPVLKTWCLNGDDRFLAISKDERDGPWLGIRPKCE